MYEIRIVEEVVSYESADNGDIESGDIVEEFGAETVEEIVDALHKGGFTGDVGMCGGPGLSVARLGEDVDFSTGDVTTATAFVYGLSAEDEAYLRRGLRYKPAHVHGGE